MRIIPIVIGTLGTTPKDLCKRLKEIGIETKIVELQKTVILNSSTNLINYFNNEGSVDVKKKKNR